MSTEFSLLLLLFLDCVWLWVFFDFFPTLFVWVVFTYAAWEQGVETGS